MTDYDICDGEDVSKPVHRAQNWALQSDIFLDNTKTIMHCPPNLHEGPDGIKKIIKIQVAHKCELQEVGKCEKEL